MDQVGNYKSIVRTLMFREASSHVTTCLLCVTSVRVAVYRGITVHKGDRSYFFFICLYFLFHGR